MKCNQTSRHIQPSKALQLCESTSSILIGVLVTALVSGELCVFLTGRTFVSSPPPSSLLSLLHLPSLLPFLLPHCLGIPTHLITTSNLFAERNLSDASQGPCSEGRCGTEEWGGGGKAKQNDVMEENAWMGEKRCDIKEEEKEKLLSSEQQQ